LLSRSSPCVAEFAEFGLNDSVQLIDPRREFLGIGFPSDALAQVDHPVAIFWGHGSGPSSAKIDTRYTAAVVVFLRGNNQRKEYLSCAIFVYDFLESFADSR